MTKHVHCITCCAMLLVFALVAAIYPDSSTTPFRGEKNANWEGGYRVPTVIKWPGIIKRGKTSQKLLSRYCRAM